MDLLSCASRERTILRTSYYPGLGRQHPPAERGTAITTGSREPYDVRAGASQDRPDPVLVLPEITPDPGQQSQDDNDDRR
ncbi:hypothetical protein Pve01_81590 [Planomonospora venezuelensis]|nr:hypothetical protein Pve01_81590 [Planomonospora venezuelensis]